MVHLSHQVAQRVSANKLAPGDVIWLDNSAWKVLLNEPAELDAVEQSRLRAYRPEYREQFAPRRVKVQHLYGPRRDGLPDDGRAHLRTHVGEGGIYRYFHGRVQLCSCCQHPWPCLESRQHEYAEKAAEEAVAHLEVPAGWCHGCKEPITSRQKSILFAGESPINPLVSDVHYHLRSKCWGAAAAFEERWVTANPTRPRSLLTLRCSGHQQVHADGIPECGSPNCPTPYAQHEVMFACAGRAGCSHDCEATGIRHIVSIRYPADPRAISIPAKDLL